MGESVDSGQVRRLLRLLGEARELPAGSEARTRHVFDGVCGILGARLGALVEVDDFRPGGTGRIRSALPGGCVEPDDVEAVIRPMLERGSFVEPALATLVEKGAPSATVRRHHVLADRDWYRAEFVMENRRRARIDDAIFSYRACRADGPGDLPHRVRGMCFNRAWGDRAFTDEDTNLVKLLAEECAWLFEPAPPPPRLAPSLSPRERDTLTRFLAGDSEKEVAEHLGLSSHTVHQYAKSIYRKLSVRSRGELLARLLSPPE